MFYRRRQRPRVLRSVAADRAAALVITLDRPAAAERLVAAVRPLYPDSPSSCEGTTAKSAPAARLGRHGVVPETLELSLIIGETVLRRTRGPEDVVADAAELVRRYHTRATR